MRVVKNREEDRTLLTQLALSLGFEETCSKLHDNCLSEIRADRARGNEEDDERTNECIDERGR
jgi:hypothetical protein